MTIDDTIARLSRDIVQTVPEFDYASIGIVVSSGVVRLFGRVETDALRQRAGSLIAKVHGVTKVVNELRIEAADGDFILKKDLEKVLKNRFEVPYDRIAVNVHEGVVTLSGVVRWNYQKEAALQAVAPHAVRDDITVDPASTVAIDPEAIWSALKKEPGLDSTRIELVLEGGTALLFGSVPSGQQREMAQEIVRNALGVKEVKNAMQVAD